MLTWIFILARIIANPVSNLFQKQLTQRSTHPVFIFAATHALLSLFCLPYLLTHHLPGAGAFWANMVTCAVLTVAGNVLLIYALETSDLSVLGPINAYKSVVGLVLGIFLIGEIPSRLGVVGMVLILAGSYLVVDRVAHETRQRALARFFAERGIQFRFAALVFSAMEAVFLKRAMRFASPGMVFALWATLGLAVIVTMVPWFQKGLMAGRASWLRNARTYIWLALTTGIMQLTTLFTFDVMPVSYSLALFQLSTLVSVFLGYRYFDEGHLGRRLIASLIMITGAVLIVLWGR